MQTSTGVDYHPRPSHVITTTNVQKLGAQQALYYCRDEIFRAISINLHKTCAHVFLASHTDVY